MQPVRTAPTAVRGTLTPKGYRPRLLEGRLTRMMQAFGCVDIVGPRWCGKTWLALSQAASATHLDRREEREAAATAPELALVGDQPHLVDEWQEVPQVWDAVRSAIDASGNKRGQFLLTGSSDLTASERQQVTHSGTGRIARLRMRPLSLLESGDSSGTISLEALFNGAAVSPARRDTSLQEVATWCCRGGWPANVTLGSDEAAMETARQYIQSVLDKNVPDEGKSPQTALAAMRAIAMNASQAVTLKTLVADMGQAQVSTATLDSYLNLFDRLYLTERLAGWEPPLRAKARVRVKPKRYFVDPSLASALLDATPDHLCRDAQTLGLLFENLVLRDLNVYLSTYGGLGDGIMYYRDEHGLEADAVLEHAGTWAGIEIKLSDTKADEGAASLLACKKKLCGNKLAQVPEPAFLAVIVGRGGLAYQRDDGVWVIPIATLAP